MFSDSDVYIPLVEDKDVIIIVILHSLHQLSKFKQFNFNSNRYKLIYKQRINLSILISFSFESLIGIVGHFAH